MKKKHGAVIGAILMLTQLCSSALPTSAAISADASYAINESGEAVGAALSADTEVSSRFLELLFGKKKKSDGSGDINEEKKEENRLCLCPGGDAFGVKIVKSAVSVVNADEESALKCGDLILSIDGKRIRTLSDVKKILDDSDGRPLSIVAERGGEKFEAELIPKKTDGGYKLGAVLKDGVAGIGTVTYYDPTTGEFGGLGHAICESGRSEPVKMLRGSANGVILSGIERSETGKPGELTGLLTDEVIGEIYCNTGEGVFGKLNKIPDSERIAIPVGKSSDVHEGEATIYATVKNGKREEYKIEIFDIDHTSSGSKSFKIRVTDETLKALTGGIVRGMSGSPIIQDGKLIGAVTHVMVSEPTVGYGIFIENMLNAAKSPMPKAA